MEFVNITRISTHYFCFSCLLIHCVSPKGPSKWSLGSFRGCHAPLFDLRAGIRTQAPGRRGPAKSQTWRQCLGTTATDPPAPRDIFEPETIRQGVATWCKNKCLVMRWMPQRCLGVSRKEPPSIWAPQIYASVGEREIQYVSRVPCVSGEKVWFS